MSKHMRTVGNWDDVVPLACAAYNFLPNDIQGRVHSS